MTEQKKILTRRALEISPLFNWERGRIGTKRWYAVAPKVAERLQQHGGVRA
jgi:hypothetical protein